jgi:putative transposase
MQHWLSGYANWYSKRNRRVGHLYQGRYKAPLVEDDSYFWSVSRYIHLNPCQSLRPLAKSPNGWPHRGYAGYARKTSRVGSIAYDALHRFWSSQNGGKDAGGAYRKYVKEGLLLEENPFSQSLRGLVLGREAFLKQVLLLSECQDDQ